MSQRTKAILMLVGAGLCLALVLLMAFGIIDADRLQTAVAALLSIATLVWAWWRNNNVTEAAQEAQKVLDNLKAGEE